MITASARHALERGRDRERGRGERRREGGGEKEGVPLTQLKESKELN